MGTIDEFRDSLSEAAPPVDGDVALQALWWAGKAEWERAHGLVQSREGDPHCDRVHAYLHRQEGDAQNAGYWYRQAGRAMPSMPLEQEWTALAAELLSR